MEKIKVDVNEEDKTINPSIDNNVEVKLENKEIKLKEVSEGKVNIRQSNDSGTFCPFYNPAQELNRDLSVVGISSYQDMILIQKLEKANKKSEEPKEYTFNMVDAMSATGLRAVRYLKELSSIKNIYANDIDEKAVELIKINAERNGDTEGKIIITKEDCNVLLYSKMKFFDVVDLDPYGTAVNMLDAAIQGVKNGGLILATFTDMQVLCGCYTETCYYKYGSIPYKTIYCHEMAKRIALYTISSSAARYKKAIIPLLSFNAEFYIRLLFIVKDSPELCQENLVKHGQVIQCRSCQYRKLITYGIFESKGEKKNKYRINNLSSHPEKCPVCDGFLILIGPYWIGDLHDENYLKLTLNKLQKDEFSYLKYNKRIQAILSGMLDEMEIKDVFPYDYSQLCSDLNMSAPKMSLFK